MKEQIKLFISTPLFWGERIKNFIFTISFFLGGGGENKKSFIFPPVFSGRENGKLFKGVKIVFFICSFTLGPS